MVHMEHTHILLTLLGLLALLLLAVSVAGASGWQEGDGVRYTTYRTPPPAYQVAAPGSTIAATPVVRLMPIAGTGHLVLWFDSAAAGTNGWIVAPLLHGVESPSCAASGQKEDHQ
jgi:hypothetical protein